MEQTASSAPSGTPSKEQRNWAMFAHLSALLVYPTLIGGIVGPWLELVVTDEGPGFDEFDELGTLGLSQKATGLGIGLALAEATAERLDGELAASNTGHGAQMRLRLPLQVIGDHA